MREIRMLRTMRRKLETGPRNGLRHRKMAKASGKQQLPVPVVTAPAFDPTRRGGQKRAKRGPRALRVSFRPHLQPTRGGAARPSPGSGSTG